MVTQEKLVIAYRFKETKTTYKKGLAASIFLSVLSLGIGIVLMFIDAKDGGVGR